MKYHQMLNDQHNSGAEWLETYLTVLIGPRGDFAQASSIDLQSKLLLALELQYLASTEVSLVEVSAIDSGDGVMDYTFDNFGFSSIIDLPSRSADK